VGMQIQPQPIGKLLRRKAESFFLFNRDVLAVERMRVTSFMAAKITAAADVEHMVCRLKFFLAHGVSRFDTGVSRPFRQDSVLTQRHRNFEKIFCLPKDDTKLHPSS